MRPERAIVALHAGIATHKPSPFTCRQAGQSPFLGELVVSLGHSGHVAVFEVEDATTVTVLAVRHQREDDHD